MLLTGVQHYNEIKGISICEFLPPHLSIYIDLPAEEVQKKLKQSGKVVRHTPRMNPQPAVIAVGDGVPVKTWHSRSLISSGGGHNLSSGVGTAEQNNSSRGA